MCVEMAFFNMFHWCPLYHGSVILSNLDVFSVTTQATTMVPGRKSLQSSQYHRAMQRIHCSGHKLDRFPVGPSGF